MEKGEYWLANTTWLVLLIIGIVLYKLFKSDASDKKKRSRRQVSQSSSNNLYATRQTGRDSPRRSQKDTNKTNSSFIQSAKRQEKMKNYDEASQLYLRGGQVYSAAKMKVMKGPTGAEEAINIIEVNSPDQVEMVTRNLVNEFYYRLGQPATAAALLRSVGLVDEAIAVEVTAGIAPQVESVNVQTATTHTEVEPVENTEPVVDTMEEESVDDISVIEEVEAVTPAKPNNIQNTLLMASVLLSDKCIVCRRDITTGDSFLQCQSCGKPGHYKHIAEMIKVTGKCPNCKERLVMHMFNL